MILIGRLLPRLNSLRCRLGWLSRWRRLNGRRLLLLRLLSRIARLWRRLLSGIAHLHRRGLRRLRIWLLRLALRRGAWLLRRPICRR